MAQPQQEPHGQHQQHLVIERKRCTMAVERGQAGACIHNITNQQTPLTLTMPAARMPAMLIVPWECRMAQAGAMDMMWSSVSP